MIIDLDAVSIEPGQILVDGVRQWRADCGIGQFKIGQSTMRGPRIEMEIIAAKSKYCQPFKKYPPMDWLGLLFVDSEGVLSSILFKKESRTNFFELLRQFKLAGKSTLGKIIKASMSARAGQSTDENGNTIAVSYFAVEFEVQEKSAKYADAIKQLRDTVDCNAMIQFQEIPAPAIESKTQILAAVRAAA